MKFRITLLQRRWFALVTLGCAVVGVLATASTEPQAVGHHRSSGPAADVNLCYPGATGADAGYID